MGVTLKHYCRLTLRLVDGVTVDAGYETARQAVFRDGEVDTGANDWRCSELQPIVKDEA